MWSTCKFRLLQGGCISCTTTACSLCLLRQGSYISLGNILCRYAHVHLRARLSVALARGHQSAA